MQLALFSERCFHCVDLNQFSGPEPVAWRVGNLVGTPCPLCGVTIMHGDLTVVMDNHDMDKIQSGTAMWNTSGRPRGFEGFFPQAADDAHSSSEIARKLRSQLAGTPSERRRTMCEVGTRVLVHLGGVAARLDEAEEKGDTDRTRRAYRVIVDYGDDRVSAAAAIQLGQIEQKLSNHAAAIRLYRKAAETSDRTLKPIACLCLGGALGHAGDTAGARRAFRECVDCGESTAQAEAAYRLGNMLRLEDPVTARELYEIVLSYGDGKCSAGAALNLGVICAEEGGHAEAKQRWEYAFDKGDERERTVAAFNLGRAWESEGRIRRAKAFYRIAIASPQPEAARQAQDRLAELG